MILNETLDKWQQYLNSGDLLGVVSLYDKNAILWGTFSNIIRNNHDLIEEYFKGLIEKKELSVTFNSIITRQFSDVSVFSGTYNFSYESDGIITHHCRFTFVIATVNSGEHKIIEHHSSVIPNKA